GAIILFFRLATNRAAALLRPGLRCDSLRSRKRQDLTHGITLARCRSHRQREPPPPANAGCCPGVPPLPAERPPPPPPKPPPPRGLHGGGSERSLAGPPADGGAGRRRRLGRGPCRFRRGRSAAPEAEGGRVWGDGALSRRAGRVADKPAPGPGGLRTADAGNPPAPPSPA